MTDTPTEKQELTVEITEPNGNGHQHVIKVDTGGQMKEQIIAKVTEMLDRLLDA